MATIKQTSHFDTVVSALKRFSINFTLDTKHKEKFDSLAQICFNY